ncbi:MAG: hypothetical protein KatS3mg057_2134 [Herpetosiphonaceae bacterium]|nr:MAG: hypothetical protein KatS3mg057_2134 [Herpetosiphonaceae bacterium]
MRTHRHSHRRQTIAFVVLMLLVIQILAACGGGSPQTGQDEGTPGAEQPTTVPTKAAEQPPTATPSSPHQPTATAGEPGTPERPSPTPPPPGAILSTPRLEYGVVAHLYYTDRERALTLAKNAGFDWVRQQIHWKDIEGPKGNFGWGELDAIVEAANAHNIKLLISVVQSPSWARADGKHGLPDNPKDLGDFVEALATRYKGRVHGYEIWNEQNLAIENAGQVTAEDAAHYVELLIESYKRIKAVDPNAYVLAGAPSSTETNDPNIAIGDLEYYRLMYTYKDGIIKNYFDAQAVHPGGALNPPDTLWPENPGPGPEFQTSREFYFRRIEDVRKVMEEHGLADRQIWITEFGWATANNTPGYEFGNRISYELQAEYILGALQRTRNHYPWVGVIFLWNLNFAVLWGEQGNPLHEQASYGILNPDWSPRPAFHVVQGFIHAVRQEEGW